MTAAAGLEASASASGNETDLEYPDPTKFNLNDTHDQLAFMHK